MATRSSRTLTPDVLADPDATLRGPPEGFGLLGHATPLTDAFTLGRTLGTGGTAIVWLARQHSLDREVALKAPKGAGSLDAATRVLQEAWVTGYLEHPGVCAVHDVAVDEAGCPHIVMRRLEGWTWSELIESPDLVAARFGARDVLAWHLRILMSVSATVHHAHRRGVLHRDIKPDNVMVGPTGEAYVLDWGLAAALDEAAARYLPRAAEVSGLAGTPRYMAPEMALEGGVLGVATDVYLLGGLLFAVLTGEGPHPGESVEEVIASIAAFEVCFGPDVPSRLAALARVALAHEPLARPQSADAFRLGVLGYLEERAADAQTATGERELGLLRAARTRGAGPEEVLRHFGACRASLEQALAAWPDAAAPRAALSAAREELARWELARGNPEAARLVLAEMEAPPRELEADVANACVEAAAREARARELVADNDPAVGVRTRTFVSVVLGLAFTLVPLAIWLLEQRPSLSRMALGELGLFVLALGLWAWARESLGRSALNRALIRTAAAAPMLHAAGTIGGGALGFPPELVAGIAPLTSAALVTGLAITLEPWLLLATVGFVGAYLVATRNPEFAWPAHALSNGWLLLVALGRWGPDARRAWRALRESKRG